MSLNFRNKILFKKTLTTNQFGYSTSRNVGQVGHSAARNLQNSCINVAKSTGVFFKQETQ
ncbi:unnamed protein product [Ceratitis capitata]|uniref:(Mediterranean fruit fly) hypothetical protein n=1 Tax=Ceratitis capitata TaxID=7213 RepID=A0A811VF04_CERCA|nr:unnamed protein product [Ceratitis capitata]